MTGRDEEGRLESITKIWHFINTTTQSLSFVLFLINVAIVNNILDNVLLVRVKEIRTK